MGGPNSLTNSHRLRFGQTNAQEKPQPYPDYPASKTLSWHLASENHSASNEHRRRHQIVEGAVVVSPCKCSVFELIDADEAGIQQLMHSLCTNICKSVKYFTEQAARNLTQRQRMLIEEFAKEKQADSEKGDTAAGALG